jgi:hypothetical protein
MGDCDQMRWKHTKAYLDNIRSGNGVQEEALVEADGLPLEAVRDLLFVM